MIDMPSAEMTSDGMLAISEGYFKGGLRTTVTSQILPNVSASFRYANAGVNGDEALEHSNWTAALMCVSSSSRSETCTGHGFE